MLLCACWPRCCCSYLAILVLALLVALLRRPLALLGAAVALSALMCFNDPFSSSLK
jgi:hypothetical protein